ncbi:hypothetical protein D5H78_04110 [Vallicoccus soli]|uniref:HTH luxR-type domain-containing protein n=1 Tax=Vallicoccus soli TaxID=2339232 RepID=A0A3A3Z4V4_9ACTN|nr:hypothetical protein D5H78_04110 [Vallicoccus soli]
MLAGDRVVHADAAAGAVLERHRLDARAVAGAAGTGGVGVLHGPRGDVHVRARPGSGDGRRVLVLADDAQRVRAAAAAGLSARQAQVLALVAGGATAQAAAHRLGLSPRTVQKHLQVAYRALGVGDRLEAVLRARELGVLPPGP